MVGEKVCSRCGYKFPNDNDHFSYTSKDGVRYLRAMCKPCQSLASAAHYQQNKAKIKEQHVAYNRRYRAEHRNGYNYKNRLYRRRVKAETE